MSTALWSGQYVYVSLSNPARVYVVDLRTGKILRRIVSSSFSFFLVEQWSRSQRAQTRAAMVYPLDAPTGAAQTLLGTPSTMRAIHTYPVPVRAPGRRVQSVRLAM